MYIILHFIVLHSNKDSKTVLYSIMLVSNAKKSEKQDHNYILYTL